jgi:hypothetical protein
MAYLMLVMEHPQDRVHTGPDEGRRRMQAMVDYGERLREQGLLLGSDALRGHRHAQRIQKRDGAMRLIDGPFAEAREMVGGYFLLNCATREQALAAVSECPAAAWATLELRETGPCFDD